jgi:hypothetical protein
MNKKDTNYIAAVEKAISEKYGKNTVQDFRKDWCEQKEKIYLDQLKNQTEKIKHSKIRKEKKQVGEVFISKPLSNKKTERVCPVCKTYSFSSQDDLYMNRFQCCSKCYFDFVDHQEDRWKSGWRPSEEQLEIALLRRKK